MRCFIYRSRKNPDTYIYLAEKDDFSSVPAKIAGYIGQIEFAMELELNPDTKLAREDTTTVLTNLEQHGFHIQLPDRLTVEEIMTRIAENSQP